MLFSNWPVGRRVRLDPSQLSGASRPDIVHIPIEASAKKPAENQRSAEATAKSASQRAASSGQTADAVRSKPISRQLAPA